MLSSLLSLLNTAASAVPHVVVEVVAICSGLGRGRGVVVGAAVVVVVVVGVGVVVSWCCL